MRDACAVFSRAYRLSTRCVSLATNGLGVSTIRAQLMMPNLDSLYSPDSVLWRIAEAGGLLNMLP
jgi:hypothetical protein